MTDISKLAGLKMRPGTEYVAEVPAAYADGRADMQEFGRSLYLSHPDHPPLMMRGDKIWRDVLTGKEYDA